MEYFFLDDDEVKYGKYNDTYLWRVPESSISVIGSPDDGDAFIVAIIAYDQDSNEPLDPGSTSIENYVFRVYAVDEDSAEQRVLSSPAISAYCLENDREGVESIFDIDIWDALAIYLVEDPQRDHDISAVQFPECDK